MVREDAGRYRRHLGRRGRDVGSVDLELLREQERLMDEFTDTTRRQAHASVDALSARLDALDQDTRMLADLLERSHGRGAAALESEHRVWEAASTRWPWWSRSIGR